MSRELCSICGLRVPGCTRLDCPWWPATPAASKVQHLTISQRIVRAHLNMRHVSIDATRDRVLWAASAEPGSDDDKLREKLERATECDIQTLAKLTKDWPT